MERDGLSPNLPVVVDIHCRNISVSDLAHIVVTTLSSGQTTRQSQSSGTASMPSWKMEYSFSHRRTRILLHRWKSATGICSSTYDISELLHSDGNWVALARSGANPESDPLASDAQRRLNLLISLIKTQIDPKSWHSYGSEEFTFSDGRLSISQKPENLRAIADLLQILRRSGNRSAES